ncbi:MAG: hypothetical protein QM676_05325 [Novosphingobium sp.]
MIWKTIRLELATTADYPRGSPSRAYLLRLPLGENGAIDRTALQDEPRQATVRRFWPSEPDLAGYVVPSPGGWVLAYDRAQSGNGSGKLEGNALRLGDCVTMTEPDGRRLPFRVAALETLS